MAGRCQEAAVTPAAGVHTTMRARSFLLLLFGYRLCLQLLDPGRHTWTYRDPKRFYYGDDGCRLHRNRSLCSTNLHPDGQHPREWLRYQGSDYPAYD